jgi:hypothetical protein
MNKIPIDRFYRKGMGADRFNSFQLIHQESDIWFGLSPAAKLESIKKFASKEIKALRKKIDTYINNNPIFPKTLEPIEFDHSAPGIIKKMMFAAKKAGTGPMATIAGTFSEYIGEKIIKHFRPEELILENGGDNYLVINKPILTSIYAGNSPLSDKVALRILPEHSPLGICTSAGSFGASRSFGKADAVVIAAKNTILADAWATSLANKIQNKKDIDKIISQAEKIPEVLSCIIIKDDKLAVNGKLEIELL